MIHINRSKDKKFYVTVVAENGEILSTSETLNSKQAAWKNIAAQCKAFNHMTHVLVTIGKFEYWFDSVNNKKQINS